MSFSSLRQAVARSRSARAKRGREASRRMVRSRRLRCEALEDRRLLSVVPNDPLFSDQWALDNTGQTGGTWDADIDAPSAWSVTTGDTSTVIAVLDTGVDYTHEDLYLNIWLNQGEIPAALASNLTDTDADGLITYRDLNDAANASYVSDLNTTGYIDVGDLINDPAWADGVDTDGNGYVDDISGYDFVNDVGDPRDVNGHGTIVSGILAATGDNATGISGVCWTAQIMPLKFHNADGTGSVDDAAEALDYAVANGAKVSNHSWGAPDWGAPWGYSEAVRTTIANASASGHIVVAASGNGGFDWVGDDNDAPEFAAYPASYDLDNIISVAATDSDDVLTSFSNYGATTVDLGAPGVDIRSTYNGGYHVFPGATSWATPHVTGAVALVQSQHPEWTYSQVIDKILATVDPSPSLLGKTVSGGRLNAAAAVDSPIVEVSEVSIDDAVVTEGDTHPQLVDDFVTRRLGGLHNPRGIAFGPQGDLFVASSEPAQVLQYDGLTGEFVGVFADASEAGSNPWAAGLEFDANYMYVTTGWNNSVLRFDAQTGAPAPAAGQTGATFVSPGAGGLSEVWAVAVGPVGHLYVASFDTDNILRYDGVTGALIDVFVTAGSGGLDGPGALIFDADGLLYVGSSVTDEVLRYQGPSGASPGAFLDAFVPAHSGGLDDITGLAFGPGDDLYVSSFHTDEVLRYSGATGDFVDSIAAASAGTLDFPIHIAFDDDGTLYTASCSTHRVLRSAPASQAVFTASLSFPSRVVPVTVDFHTISGTATPGSDYVAAAGTLTFAPGETSKAIVVTTLDDAIAEGNETFTVDLSNPTGGAIIVAPQGVATIMDDDLSVVPDDPLFPDQWALDNTGQAGGTWDADIDAPAAWSMTTGSSSTVVAVLDTGIDYTHEDLYLNIWINQDEIPATLASALSDTDADGRITFRDLNDAANASYVTDLNGTGYIDGGDLLADPAWADGADADANGYTDDLVGWDWVNNDNDPMDTNSHGTMVTGLLGAVGDNGIGIAGVNWAVQMMPLRFKLNNTTWTVDAAVNAIDYAVDQGTPISNNSWGSTSGEFIQEIYDAIDRARLAGHLFVAAAGNSARDTDSLPRYPADYDLDNIISVAATNHENELASFSNWGATSVDLGAPSPSVMTTYPGNQYGNGSGTSAATPHVAGVAALLHGLYPGWTAAELKGRILSTVDPLASLAGKIVSGGTLNAAAAVSDSSIHIGDPNIVEGNSGSASLEFGVTRRGDTTEGVTLNWTTRDGTATEGSDYVAASGQVVFSAGETEQLISVAVNGDMVDEENETLYVGLELVSGSATIADPTAQGTILNDDTIVSVGDVTVTEGDTTLGYLGPVVSPGGITRAIGMEFDIATGMLYMASATDNNVLQYDTNTGEVTEFIARGSNGLSTPRDILIGPDNNLYVASGGTDSVLRFNLDGSYLDVFVSAGSTDLDYPAGLVFDDAGNLYVTSFNTDEVYVFDGSGAPVGDGVFIDATANGGMDKPTFLAFDDQGVLYITDRASNSVLRFDSDGTLLGTFGETGSSGLSIPLGLAFDPSGGDLYIASYSTDEIMRFDGATGDLVEVVVNGASGAPDGAADLVFGQGPCLYASGYNGHEVQRYGALWQAAFPVTLAVPSKRTITVDFSTSDGSATASSDYTASSGTVTFLPGETLRTIIVPTIDDLVSEDNETFFVTLSNPTGGATIADPQGVATIVDADVFEITIDDVTVTEGDDTGVFVDVFAPDPATTGALDGPCEFVIGPDGNMYVADVDEVHRYDMTTGDLIDVFVPSDAIGGPAFADSVGPFGLAFSPLDHNLYVSSWDGNEVLRYQGPTGPTPGAFIDTFISSGSLDKAANLLFDSEGTLYVSSIDSDEVLHYDAKGDFIDAVVSAIDGLDDPFDLVLDDNGGLLVASSATSQILRYDIATDTTSVFVSAGSGGLAGAQGLEFGLDGNLYVASTGTNQVLRYDGSSGAFDGIFVPAKSGGLMWTGDLLFAPDGEMYVSSYAMKAILKFDGSTGAFLDHFALSPRPTTPRGLEFGPDGSLYVTNWYGSSVKQYDGQSGTFIEHFVQPNSGGLSGAAELHFGPDGNLYVASADQDSIFRFDGNTGAFMDTFIPPGEGGLDNPREFIFHTDGMLYVSSLRSESVLRFESATGQFIDEFIPPHAGGLSAPTGMTFGPDGDLYVLDRNSGDVFRYDETNGEFLDIFAVGGGQVVNEYTDSIVFGPDGNLYVNSATEHRVLRYDGATGKYLGDFVSAGQGGLFEANAFAFDSNGSLYVCDQGTTQGGHIMRYAPASHAAFRVTLSNPSATFVTVDYATSNGTAEPGSDFATVSGTLTFAPGETSKTILVQTIDDLIREDDETFIVTLFNPTGGATLADWQGQATIIDVEAPLFSDSFENGQWDGKWVEDSQDDWLTSTQRETDGNYSAEVNGSATDATLTMAQAVDMTPYGSAELTFDWYMESGFISGDYVALDFSPDGSNWTEIKRLRGDVDQENVWHNETIDIDPVYLTGGFKVRFRATVSGSGVDANVDNIQLVATSLAALPDELTVQQFVYTPTGFIARFGRDVNPAVLNLYDDIGALHPADVTIQGATHGAVKGSLLVSDDQRQVTFIKTGGVLQPDTYTVTLFSGATRFVDTDGNPLDGNGDGTVGDNFTTSFTATSLAANTVTISIPDFARGAGQAVNVPAEAAGLPIRIDNAAGVTAVTVEVVYEPALLNITEATLAAGLPADWSVRLDSGTPGVAKIEASGETELAGTNVDVVRLTAAVPNTAPYGTSQAMRLDNISLNNGAIEAIGDVAVHKAAYLGDADSSGIHSSADAFLTVQAALGLAGGFSAHAWTDPRIVGDADASGVLSAADAFLIVQEGLGLAEPFVPDNPHISITPVGGGIDPQFQIGANLSAIAGDQVSVPVMLDIESAATNVGGFDFDLFFDPTVLTIDVPGGVSAGADTAAGWAVTSRLIAAGHLRVGMVSEQGAPLAPGRKEIATLVFRVATSFAPSLQGEGRGEGSFAADAAHVDASLRDAIPGLRETGLPKDPVSERPAYVALLDIEPVDPRAGGYAWAAVDGSLLISPAPPAPWHNAANRFDVNGDGMVTPGDALAVIHYLNSQTFVVAPSAALLVSAYYYDVNNDRACTPLDVLAVVNQLNAEALAEGERGAVAPTWSAVVSWAEPRHGGTGPSDAVAVHNEASETERAATGREFLGPRNSPPDWLAAFGARAHPLHAISEGALRARAVLDETFRDPELELSPLGEVISALAEDVVSAMG